MWTYNRITMLLAGHGKSFLCYAGHGKGLNNPMMEKEHDIGPLPAGGYTMLKLFDSPHTGNSTIVLIPKPTNQMYGRGDFRIHGDNDKKDFSASKGCIIHSPAADRILIWNSGDHELVVI